MSHQDTETETLVDDLIDGMVAEIDLAGGWSIRYQEGLPLMLVRHIGEENYLLSLDVDAYEDAFELAMGINFVRSGGITDNLPS